MQRYFAKDIIDNIVQLDTKDIHHIKNVMRMKPNSIIEVVHNNNLYNAYITSNYQVKITSTIDNYQKTNKEIILSPALIKEQKQDLIFQKATELGVSKIIPLSLERCVVKIDKSKELKKKERWSTICKEASEQSKRLNIPTIENISTLEELCNTKADLKIILNTKEDTKTLKNVLNNNPNCDKIIVVIGPEGGLTDKEVKYLEENGYISVTLGNNILRAETACISVLSMINYHFMRWDNGSNKQT